MQKKKRERLLLKKKREKSEPNECRLSIGSIGNERNALLLGLLQLGLLFSDLLHLKHSLHDELVLALLIGVPLVLALPWEKELGLAALVERDQQVGALVSVRQRNPRLHHLSLCCYHLLCWSLDFHGCSLFHNYDDLIGCFRLSLLLSSFTLSALVLGTWGRFWVLVFSFSFFLFLILGSLAKWPNFGGA